MYYFKKPFAEEGDITQIPVESQGEGSVSYTKGWEEGYSLDPQDNPDDAKNLSRTNFNGLFFNITQALQQFQKYGVNPYITSSDNGGEPYSYELGGMCSYIDPTTGDYGVYYSLSDNNTSVPSENGVTNRFWQRIFDKKVDTIKSNRVRNAILYYTDVPDYDIDSENVATINIRSGTRILFSNGINSDGTYKNEIVQLSSDLSQSLQLADLPQTIFIFVATDERIFSLSAEEYSVYESEEEVIIDKGDTSDSNVYYFNSDDNIWKKRLAGETEFIDLDTPIINIARFTGGVNDSCSISYMNALQIVESTTFNEQLSKKQQTLIPTKRVTLTNVKNEGQLLDVKINTEATPFCINSGNLDSNGNLSLCVTSSVVLDNVQQTEILPNMGNYSLSSPISGSNYSSRRQTTVRTRR